ncbi:unnamed protein product [Chironomus riparius]|uniref:MD-2-related lipid-recognition domain-containing protein n=1 Tax=Chironomus riparius TaxID=315576 RepID=A0A9N9S816_9DIPT|nr:unnamed protein product [Chironomus riparius]
MKLLIQTVLIFLLAACSLEIDLKVLSMDKCYGNEKYLVIKKCEILDDNLFEVKAYLVSHVDSIIFKPRISKLDKNKKFREIFKNAPAIDWCKIADKNSRLPSNPLTAIAVMLVKSKFPELQKPCPWDPFPIEHGNLTIGYRVLAIIPNGIYKAVLIAENKEGENYADVAFTFEIY